MKKIIMVLFVISVLLVSIGMADISAKNQKQKFKLPKNAVEVSPGVFYLGKAIDKGEIVEGYAFMMKDSKTKVVRKPSPPTESSCYGFLATGAKWKTAESYIVDPTNQGNLDEGIIRSNLALDISKWENSANYNILGDEVAGDVDENNIGNLNNKNEVMFGDIDGQGVIGVTIVWGIFGGRPNKRVLVEWDMIFDDADFDWSLSGEAGKMDFENIATHELGHAVGMDDLYETTCSEMTMYGYADNGETKKRTLETGDILGIQKLY